MELHTLGVDGGYTQKDVQEVARALTGWTFNRQTGEFLFNPAIHDAGEKTMLGHKLAAGRGIEEGEEVLDIVARAPATARFITTKLARHFVSDDPPKALVDRCAQHVLDDRRRHSRDGALRRHVARVLQPRSVSREGEDAVRARRVARCARSARSRTPRRAPRRSWRVSGSRSSATRRPTAGPTRRRVDEHGRDPQPDQLRAERSPLDSCPARARATGRSSTRLRARRATQQVDAVVKSMLGGQVSPETREMLMSGENPMLASGGAAATSTAWR